MYLSNQNCNNGYCKVKHKFNFDGNDKCLATFKCNHLDEYACKQYGIEVTFPEPQRINQMRPVCSENAVKLGSLSPNTSVEIDVWFGQGNSSFSTANCYLWCANKPFERPIHPLLIQVAEYQAQK